MKAECEKTGDYDTLALVKKVVVYSIEKLKVVIKYMGNFTLHDEVHIFNMLNINNGCSIIKIRINSLKILSFPVKISTINAGEIYKLL